MTRKRSRCVNRFSVSIVFAVSSLVLVPHVTQAWDKDVHPALNLLGAELLELRDTPRYYKELYTEPYMTRLRQGGLQEDADPLHPGSSVRARRLR